MRVFLRLVTVVCTILYLTAPAHAQFVPNVTADEADVVSAPSPNDVKEFLRLLADPSIQSWLANSVTEAGDVNTGPVLSPREQADAWATRIRARLQSVVQAWSVVPQLPSALQDVWNTELSHAQKVRSLTYILIFLLIGAGLEWLYRQTLRYPLLRIEQAPKDAPMQKLIGSSARAAIIFAGLGIFAIGSIGAFNAFEWHPLVETLVLDLLICILMFRIITTLSLFLQAPRAPELRLVPYGSQAALFLHRIVSVMGFAVVAAPKASSFRVSRYSRTARGA